jgi:hypothetical protein
VHLVYSVQSVKSVKNRVGDMERGDKSILLVWALFLCDNFSSKVLSFKGGRHLFLCEMVLLSRETAV